MERSEIDAELARPLAAQLLRAAPLLRLAYVALDGTPRVIPLAFLWTRQRIVVCTIPSSGKVKALREHREVAVTIDHDGLPSRALLIRGIAEIDVVDGVPDEYLQASLKTQSARGAEDFAAGVRAMYDAMARVTITPPGHASTTSRRPCRRTWNGSSSGASIRRSIRDRCGDQA